MEAAIGRTISKSLGLSTIQMYVLMKNIQFLNKLHILGAIIDLSELSPDDLRRFRSTIALTQNLYGNRNIVAHEMFMPSETNDGVMFLVVRARGTVKFPDADWSVDYFDNIFRSLLKLTGDFIELADKLTKPITLAEILAAAPYAPTGEFGGLAPQNLLAPLLPTDHTSETTSANPETDPEIPPSPEK